MGQVNYKKILFFIGYFSLAFVSCWATQKSLHLLLPSYPVVFCWIVTIVFFFIASLGTKMIVDSFSPNTFVQHRYAKLIGGLIIVILFWLVCSMPTNTHTFFYNEVIGDIVNQDVTRTSNYLIQIQKNEGVERLFEKRKSELTSKVNIKLGELKAEIENDANPGFGPNAKRILSEFAELLEVPKIDPLSYNSASINNRQKLYEAYRSKIFTLRDSKIQDMKIGMQKPSKASREQATAIVKNLELSRNYVSQGKMRLDDAEDIMRINDQLSMGYNIIKINKDFIFWSPKTDEQHYVQESTITDVKRMISVFDVWKDFLAGKYEGRPFIFWIVISVLVDIAAFVCFRQMFN